LLPAFRLVRRTFADRALPTRLHAAGRFLTCPFLPVLDRLPPGARVLDLGSGHGTFARLAVERGAALVVAADPDARKAFATYRHPRVRFVVAYAGAIGGEFDAVTLFDVLCRVPVPEWDALLAAAFARLRPGGVLLLKEIDPAHRWKGRWNRAQERLADVLGMTLGDAFSYETRAAMTARLAGHGFTAVEAVDLGRGYPHAHLLYTARRPPAAGPAGPTSRC
jgi:2-polyprenyl-6-hydroxyphenyl methylase/3-demethylubiquinone-9 3-methyltransferase